MSSRRSRSFASIAVMTAARGRRPGLSRFWMPGLSGVLARFSTRPRLTAWGPLSRLWLDGHRWRDLSC